MNYLAYVAYLWHLRGRFIVGTYIVMTWKIKVSLVGFYFYFDLYIVIWDLHVDYFIWSHDQKSHVASHFNQLNLSDTLVPLKMLLA